MRALAHVDISVAARALLCLPEAARENAIIRMVREAEAADHYRKRLDRAHPLWGNGTLEAAARSPAAWEVPNDASMRSALAEVGAQPLFVPGLDDVGPAPG